MSIAEREDRVITLEKESYTLFIPSMWAHSVCVEKLWGLLRILDQEENPIKVNLALSH